MYVDAGVVLARKNSHINNGSLRRALSSVKIMADKAEQNVKF